MNAQLAKTQIAAREAADDFKALTSALVQLAQGSTAAWQFEVRANSHAQPLPVSPAVLRNVFEENLRETERLFLNREQAAGKHWPTIREFIFSSSDQNEQAIRRNYLRLLTWRRLKGRFLEALCLLATLRRMTSDASGPPIDIFGQIGPIQLNDSGRPRFLSTRPAVGSKHTGLRAWPDVVLSLTRDPPSPSNIAVVIECKCRRSIGATDLRGEFGKAYDLGSPSYTLLSYHAVPPSLIKAGADLGLDVQVLKLSTPERDIYLRGERDLGEDTADDLQRSRERRLFLAALGDRLTEVRRRVS
jgi:hypothetical protein